MKSESYRSISAYFSETPARSTTIKALHDVLPLVMYIFYPVQLVTLAINDGLLSETFLRFTLIPLATLIIISIIRAVINAKRPYEVYEYDPPVGDKTKGKSFPSRHTVSAFIIVEKRRVESVQYKPVAVVLYYYPAHVFSISPAIRSAYFFARTR